MALPHHVKPTLMVTEPQSLIQKPPTSFDHVQARYSLYRSPFVKFIHYTGHVLCTVREQGGETDQNKNLLGNMNATK